MSPYDRSVQGKGRLDGRLPHRRKLKGYGHFLLPRSIGYWDGGYQIWFTPFLWKLSLLHEIYNIITGKSDCRFMPAPSKIYMHADFSRIKFFYFSNCCSLFSASTVYTDQKQESDFLHFGISVDKYGIDYMQILAFIELKLNGGLLNGKWCIHSYVYWFY